VIRVFRGELFASFQVSPIPTSTVTGTFNATAASIAADWENFKKMW